MEQFRAMDSVGLLKSEHFCKSCSNIKSDMEYFINLPRAWNFGQNPSTKVAWFLTFFRITNYMWFFHIFGITKCVIIVISGDNRSTEYTIQLQTNLQLLQPYIPLAHCGTHIILHPDKRNEIPFFPRSGKFTLNV